jgi:hypothetical protein
MKKLVLITITFVAALFAATSEGKAEMNIKITAGQTVIMASLNDSAPAKDLFSKLPLTLAMNRHQNREYYADIRLDKSGKTQDGYQVGDIAYWGTGNSLVLFYDKGYTGGLIIMGRITSGLDKLSSMGGDFTALIEVTE